MNHNAQDEVVYIAAGNIEAESVRILLESFGLKAYVNQESVGKTYGLTLGSLGDVEVLVPTDQAEEARKIIQDMNSGKFETTVDTDEPPDES
jgi:hypothetical protein